MIADALLIEQDVGVADIHQTARTNSIFGSHSFSKRKARYALSGSLALRDRSLQFFLRGITDQHAAQRSLENEHAACRRGRGARLDRFRQMLDVTGPSTGHNGDRHRSEERRVGKECRSRWSAYH